MSPTRTGRTLSSALMTTCPAEFGIDIEPGDFAGHCPSCHKMVLYSAEPDGPVWTCPANLQDSNPHREPQPEWITEEIMRANGCYSNCASDHGGYCEYQDMPLHAVCYDTGTW